ncbi:MAG: PDZ domain-containing protein, partial [Bacteroidetes bacterium]
LGVYLSSSYRGGAYISGVVSDAAAEDAGLRRGDVIISLNGYEINDDDDLKAVLSRLTPGQRVEVVYTRRGEERTTSVRLGRKR